MASKYGRGQVWANESGLRVEVLSVEGSIHGNTSKLGLRISGHPVATANGDTQRPVRTSHLSEMIRNFKLTRKAQ